MKRRFPKWAILLMIFVGFGALLIGSFLRQKKEEMGEDLPLLEPSRVSVIDGENIISLDETIQKKSALVVTTLESGKIPQSAVVWWNGKAWVYVEKGSGHFVRHEASTIQVGDRIVVQGAELLLSEELRSQIKDVGE